MKNFIDLVKKLTKSFLEYLIPNISKFSFISQASAGKYQIQTDKAQSQLDKTQSEFDRMQEKFERSQNEIRKVSSSKIISTKSIQIYLTLQVNNFQKVPSCWHFYQRLERKNIHDKTVVQKNLSNFSIKVWTKGTFWKLLTCTPQKMQSVPLHLLIYIPLYHFISCILIYVCTHAVCSRPP